MNESHEVEQLRNQLEETARTVQRLKLAVTVSGVAVPVLAVALLNDNLRAAIGIALAVIGILAGVLLFIAGVRFGLERLSPSPKEPAAREHETQRSHE